MNSVSELAAWGAYFRNPIDGVAGQLGAAKANKQRVSRPCRIGHTHLYLEFNGDIYLCWDYPPIGNIAKDSIPEVWSSNKAEELRARIARCSRPCTVSCLQDRGFKETVSIFFNLVKPSKLP